jgi:hypothetical protein
MENTWEKIEGRVRQLARNLSQFPGHYGWTPEHNWLCAEEFLVAQNDKEVITLRAIRRALGQVMNVHGGDVNTTRLVTFSVTNGRSNNPILIE